MMAVIHGVGKHRWELTPEDIKTALIVWPLSYSLVHRVSININSNPNSTQFYSSLPTSTLTSKQYCYLYEIFYVLVGVALKVALGIFYLRIAIERWQIILIKCIVIGASGFGVVCLFLVLLQCIPGKSFHSSRFTSLLPGALCGPCLKWRAMSGLKSPIAYKKPVNSFWLVYPSNDKCIPIPAQEGITYALNAMNACTDWILGTLPFFMVRHLNMSFRTKILVVGILAFAAVYVSPFPLLTIKSGEKD